MANRDSSASAKYVQSISPDLYQTNNTTVKGATVDTQGYDAVEIAVSINDWGDNTTGGWEFAVQHSADTVDGNFSAAADADLTYTVTGTSTVSGAAATGVFAKIDAAAEDDAVYTTNYVGSKRYVRVYAAAQGNQSTGSDLEAFVRLSKPNNAPTGANRS